MAAVVPLFAPAGSGLMRPGKTGTTSACKAGFGGAST